MSKFLIFTFKKQKAHQLKRILLKEATTGKLQDSLIFHDIYTVHQDFKRHLKSINSVNALLTGFKTCQCVLGRKCAELSVWGVSVKSYHTLILSEACECLCVFLNIWLNRLLPACLHTGMLKEVRNLHSGTFWRWSMRQLQTPICRTPTGEQSVWAGRLKMVTISNLEEFKELSMRGAEIWSGTQKKREHNPTWE